MTIRTERLTKVGSNDLPTQRPSDTLDDIDTVCAGLAGYILADGTAPRIGRTARSCRP
jgi:hypothetical protein